MKYWNHNFRTVFEYNLNDKDNLNLAYTGSFTPDQHSNSLTSGNYQASNVDKYVETRMHNITLQYHSGSGFDVGGDYTRYTSDNNQTLSADYTKGGQSCFLSSAVKK